MFLGRVVGQVWATDKVSDLAGKRLLVVEPLDERRDPAAPMVKPVVAADPVGAGIGEHVLVAFGKAARVACGGDGDFALEAAIVGIVDDFDVPGAPEHWRGAKSRLSGGVRLMLVASVVGTVWSTKKDATLEGLRLLVVRPVTTDGKDSAETMVAADTIGAGIGERVLVVFGRAARHAIGKGHDIGFQTAVVGIVDRMELEDGRTVGTVAELDTGPAAGGA